MNTNYEFYRDIDRIIRIIYKEINMLDHLGYYNQGLDNFSFDSFQLANPVFRERIKRTYIKFYPSNYDLDELECLLEDLTAQLERDYASSNSIYLIHCVSEKILHRNFNGFYVEFEDLLEWDGFINKIDMKLFMAAKLVNQDDQEELAEHKCDSVVHHDNHYIYDICKRHGLSENHMHLNASGYATDINWYAFLTGSIFDIKSLKSIIKEDGVYEGKPKNRNGERTNTDESRLIQSLIKIRFLRVVLEDMVSDKSRSSKINGTDSNPYTFETIMDILNSDDAEITAQSIVFQKDGTTEMLATQIKKDSERYIKDPLNLKGDDSSKYLQLELVFLRKLFKSIHETDNHFMIFLFNLYISGMTDLKLQIIQDNLGMGFDKFKEKEDNKKVFIKDKKSKEDMTRSTFHKYYREKYIKNVEFRMGPEDSKTDYFKELSTLSKINHEEFVRAKKDLPNTELAKINYGVIIHFIKQKNKKIDHSFIEGDNAIRDEKRDKKIDDATKWIRENIEKRRVWESKSNKLIETLDKIAELSKKDKKFAKTYQGKIVGIDTANYEKDNRPYLYSGLYRKLKNTPHKLCATYHVGEDFPTLTNGLRAIDEVLTFCEYQPNDRLGHALALGIQVADYYQKKRKNILCSLGDYLDDIVWMYGILYNSGQSEDYRYLDYLKGTFDHHKQLISLKKINPISFSDYYDAYFLKGDNPDIYSNLGKQYIIDDTDYIRFTKLYPYQLNHKHPYHKTAFLNKMARSIYMDHSYDSDFVSLLKQPFKGTATDIFIACVERVQTCLKNKILKGRIYIEANPTSNKKIAYLDKYIKLPALNLNHRYLEDSKTMINLPISINTDDSSIFQTNLVNEYSMVCAALIREGYDSQQVYDYIESLVIASNVHSFIKKQ